LQEESNLPIERKNHPVKTNQFSEKIHNGDAMYFYKHYTRLSCDNLISRYSQSYIFSQEMETARQSPPYATRDSIKASSGESG
jgi:hypothetical protein